MGGLKIAAQRSVTRNVWFVKFVRFVDLYRSGARRVGNFEVFNKRFFHPRAVVRGSFPILSPCGWAQNCCATVSHPFRDGVKQRKWTKIIGPYSENSGLTPLKLPFYNYSTKITGLTPLFWRTIWWVDDLISWVDAAHDNSAISSFWLGERTIQHITITDTTEITLGPNGISNVTLGNNGAVVITEQSGKLYANHQRFSIIPVLSHHTLTHKKWQWHNHLGIGFDIWNISRNIVSGDQAHQHLIHKEQNLSFRPLLRVGSQIRYTLRKDVQAALLLQCMYRRENYNYSSYHGFRSSIFPSIGLGLFFK